MLVYRICRAPYTALDGEGARLYGGRWNSPGHSAIYTSVHLSLAALETLVHVDFDNLPADLVWLTIEVPDDAAFEKFPHPVAPNERDAAAHGNRWLADNRSLGLFVPSAVLSVEKNLVLNPGHVDAARISLLRTDPFEFDDRLFHR